MSFALLIIGAFLLIAAIRGTQDQLFSLLKGDFTGANNFVYWFLAILAIGAVGYIPRLKPLSVALLALVIVVLFLKKGSGSNGGFFQQLFSQVSTSTTAAGKQTASAAAPTSTPMTIPSIQTGVFSA